MVNLAPFQGHRPQARGRSRARTGQAGITNRPGDAGLLLCMDFTPEQKERLLVNLIQVGIDYWGLAKSGYRGWEGWGGHGSGRKFTIVFAGMLLGGAGPGDAPPQGREELGP
jgi:hypothetical protein